MDEKIVTLPRRGGPIPYLLTEKLIDDLCQDLLDVLSIRHMCGGCEISPQCFYDWMRKGDKDIKDGHYTIYAKLVYRIKKTQKDAVQQRLERLKNRGQHWQADAWILERCFREDFGADAGAIQELMQKVSEIEKHFKIQEGKFNES